MAEKSVPRSDFYNRATSSNKRRIFNEFQDRLMNWINENYGRIVDLFRRFDVDNSGKLSYEEFADGMRDLAGVTCNRVRSQCYFQLDNKNRKRGFVQTAVVPTHGHRQQPGAPATQVEIYTTAMALDVDGDKQLDYREFKKLRHRLELETERIRKASGQAADQEDRDRSTAQLQPCPNCSVGLWEPVIENISGYIMLDLRNMSFQDLVTMPDPISAQVPSNISIYGISLIVKRELGPCTLNIKIYQPKESGEKDEMEAGMKLREFGFVGTLPPDEPEPVTLLYDYDYPLLDCPLLMANVSI